MNPNQNAESVKKLCPYYVKGICKFGRRCWNHHPLIMDITQSASAQAVTSTSFQMFNEMFQPMPMDFYREYGFQWPQFMPLNAAFGHPIQYPTGPFNGFGLEQPFPLYSNRARQTRKASNTFDSGMAGLFNGHGLEQPYPLYPNSVRQTRQELTVTTDIYISGMQEKIEMLELEIAQLTANEQKLRLEIERLNEVEKNLEELQKDIETLNLKNWLWLRPVLEEYFECTFCMEIYIKPSVINCKHTFCTWCINTWMTKNSRCPTCRTQITSMTFCSDLDKFIVKSIESGDVNKKIAYEELSNARELEGPRVIDFMSNDEDDDDDFYRSNL